MSRTKHHNKPKNRRDVDWNFPGDKANVGGMVRGVKSAGGKVKAMVHREIRRTRKLGIQIELRKLQNHIELTERDSDD